LVVGLSKAAGTGLLTVAPVALVALVMAWFLLTRRGSP
jgi:hypothetical protein